MERKWVFPAVLAALIVTGPGLVHEFVTGPGMLGSPADDPSVGYSSVTLDQKLDFPYPQPPTASLVQRDALRPWLQSWYQASEKPGV